MNAMDFLTAPQESMALRDAKAAIAARDHATDERRHFEAWSNLGPMFVGAELEASSVSDGSAGTLIGV